MSDEAVHHLHHAIGEGIDIAVGTLADARLLACLLGAITLTWAYA